MFSIYCIYYTSGLERRLNTELSIAHLHRNRAVYCNNVEVTNVYREFFVGYNIYYMYRRQNRDFDLFAY